MNNRDRVFYQTLEETKRNFSYDLNRKQGKSFCKLATIKDGAGDIHGLQWGDRVVLHVKTVDLDSKSALVVNPNGLEWVTKLKNITFCSENGQRV